MKPNNIKNIFNFMKLFKKLSNLLLKIDKVIDLLKLLDLIKFNE